MGDEQVFVSLNLSVQETKKQHIVRIILHRDNMSK
jgi:hypothetical protein